MTNEQEEKFITLPLSSGSILISKNKLGVKDISYSENGEFLSIGITKTPNEPKIEKFSVNFDNEPDFSRLFGRALARNYVNDKLNCVWVFLSTNDFEKTNLKPSEIMAKKILNNIRCFFKDKKIFILLWQEKEKVQASVLKKDNEIKTFGPYQNFSEAELKTQNALKEIS